MTPAFMFHAYTTTPGATTTVHETRDGLSVLVRVQVGSTVAYQCITGDLVEYWVRPLGATNLAETM